MSSDRYTSQESFFSYKGRIRRSTYLIRVVLLAITVAVLESIADRGSKDSLLILVLLLALTVLSLFQSIKRLHDLNKSGWYILLGIIPVVNVILLLYMIFVGSYKGSNDWGPQPRG